MCIVGLWERRRRDLPINAFSFSLNTLLQVNAQVFRVFPPCFFLLQILGIETSFSVLLVVRRGGLGSSSSGPLLSSEPLLVSGLKSPLPAACAPLEATVDTRGWWACGLSSRLVRALLSSRAVSVLPQLLPLLMLWLLMVSTFCLCFLPSLLPFCLSPSLLPSSISLSLPSVFPPLIFVEYLLCVKHCIRYMESRNNTKTPTSLELTF